MVRRQRDTHRDSLEQAVPAVCSSLFSVLFSVAGCNLELRLREQHRNAATGVQHCLLPGPLLALPSQQDGVGFSHLILTQAS